jgi:polar amino acid transport system permease protein
VSESSQPAAATAEQAHVPIKAIPVRHYGRWVSAVAVIALFALLIWSFSKGQIRWSVVPDLFEQEQIVRGALRTLWISVISMALGVVLGVVFAVMRLSRNPVTSTVSWVYIWFFRGTPVLVQLLIWYNLALVFKTFTIPGIYSAPMNQVMTPFLAALLGLGINEGAYMAEIVRAGIQSVDEGQTEASQALGMTSGQTMRRIVLPQAMRVIIPPTGNEFINMLKTSSLASVVQYLELLKTAENSYTRTLAIVETLFAVSIWYLALTSVFSVVQYFVERRFSRGSRRDAPSGPWRQLGRNLTLRTRHEGAGA